MELKVPLDSPLWDELSASRSGRSAQKALAEMLRTRRLGAAWQELEEQMTGGGDVYDVASAAIPYLVDFAPHLTPPERRDLWIEVGFCVAGGAAEGLAVLAPEHHAALAAGLHRARELCVIHFLEHDERGSDSKEGPAYWATYFALACVALAGHRVGTAIWEFPVPGDEIGWECPICQHDDDPEQWTELSDPVLPAKLAARAQLDAGFRTFSSLTPWEAVAARVDALAADEAMGVGWEQMLEVAAAVARAGVPPTASHADVWFLVAAMVAMKGPEAVPWARALTRFADEVTCEVCGTSAVLDSLLRCYEHF